MSSNVELSEEFIDRFVAAFDRIVTRNEAITRTAIQHACTGIVFGNQYGPGVPIDSGEFRTSWNIGFGAAGTAEYRHESMGEWQGDEDVILSTHALRAEPLELARWTRGGKSGTYNRRTAFEQRNHLKGSGDLTSYIEPIVNHWGRIVETVAALTPEISDV